MGLAHSYHGLACMSAVDTIIGVTICPFNLLPIIIAIGYKGSALDTKPWSQRVAEDPPSPILMTFESVIQA